MSTWHTDVGAVELAGYKCMRTEMKNNNQPTNVVLAISSSSSYARTAAACYYTTLARSSVPTFVPSFFSTPQAWVVDTRRMQSN